MSEPSQKKPGPNNPATAFPLQDRTYTFPGMSLRDHFAGLALQGMLAGNFADTVPHDDVGSDAAFFAYKYADDMLSIRNKG